MYRLSDSYPPVLMIFLAVLALALAPIPMLGGEAAATQNLSLNLAGEALAPGYAVRLREPGLNRPLPLDACVRIALDRNPLHRAALEGVTAAGEKIGLARAPYYPRVDLEAGYQRRDTHVFLPAGVGQPGAEQPDQLGATDDWQGALTAEYLVFDSGRRRAELLAAISERDAAGKDAQTIREDLTLNVHEAYYRLLATQAQEEAARESLGRSEEHLRMAELRKDVGAVPKADVVRARVKAANARLSLVRAQSDVRIARADLNGAMGLPAVLRIDVEPEGPPALLPEGVDLEGSITQALQIRSEIEALRQRAGARRHAVTAVKAGYLPRLSLEGRYGYRDEEFLPEDEDWSIGAAIRVPVFTGFARTHDVARARAEHRRVRNELQSQVLVVQQEAVTAHAKLTGAYQSVLATAVLLEDAREGLRLTRARYETGAGTINDLLDAEAELTEAETVAVRAAYDHHTTTSQFQRTVGALR